MRDFLYLIRPIAQEKICLGVFVRIQLSLPLVIPALLLDGKHGHCSGKNRNVKYYRSFLLVWSNKKFSEWNTDSVSKLSSIAKYLISNADGYVILACTFYVTLIKANFKKVPIISERTICYSLCKVHYNKLLTQILFSSPRNLM